MAARERIVAGLIRLLEKERATLTEQIDALRRAFPLRSKGVRRTGLTVKNKPARKKMSVAQRKAISKRMKAYWNKVLIEREGR